MPFRRGVCGTCPNVTDSRILHGFIVRQGYLVYWHNSCFRCERSWVEFSKCPTLQTLTKGVWVTLIRLDWFTNLDISISLKWAFGQVAWFSPRVWEVPSSILGMPHFIHLNKTCPSSVLETWILYGFQHAPFYSTQQNVSKYDVDVSWSTYNIDKGNCLSSVILHLDSSHRESNFTNALV